jgi:hypothetical protein
LVMSGMNENEIVGFVVAMIVVIDAIVMIERPYTLHCLNNAGFKWSLRKENSGFDEHFIDLMSFKAKYGHCDVSTCDEDASLGKWCSQLRVSYKKIQNNQKAAIKLSDE